MKLYYSPGACSLATHITLQEAGYNYSLEKVDLKTKTTETGADFNAINDKGYVPALKLEDGDLLTEGNAIMQYLADQKPEAGLAPVTGTKERVRLNEWLNYVSTELHKTFGALFAKVNDGAVEAGKTRLFSRFDYVNGKLEGRQFLTGDSFTIADAYLFTVLGWTKFHNIDLSRWPNLAAFSERVAQRPAVQSAMQAEGLLNKAAA